MTNDILKYITYLENECGLSVSIHGTTDKARKAINSLTPYIIHRNPYCLFIKGNRSRHNKCVAHQMELYKYKGDICAFTCMCGVVQLILPIKRGEETLGIVCVSAYRGEDRFFEQYAKETGIPHGLLMEKALHLRPLCECDEERVRMLVKPLCAMLSILLGECDESVSSAEDDLYSRMLSHIHGNAYENEVTIDTISSACYCSKSTVSHIFKKHSGTSVNQYVTNLRMERAKKLLLGTDMSITDIAYSCGYTDSNYFIYAFGRANGIPPLRYRKSHKASAF